jgi:hypothetical protein
MFSDAGNSSELVNRLRFSSLLNISQEINYNNLTVGEQVQPQPD